METILSHTSPMTFTFAQVFLAALCFYFLVHSVTCLAEIIHLKRTINEVPEPLQQKIPLAQHQKAAHYDISRTKLNWLEVTVTTLLIVYLTAGNGINSISDWLMNAVGDQFAFHWMLPASVGFIFVLIDLPFCWYKEFRLREAFGYTHQSRPHWFKNYLLTTVLGWLTVLPILWIALFVWRNSGPYWWVFGWAIFALYLVFSLNLARRLVYFFYPNRGETAENENLKKAIDALGKKAGLSVGEIRITKSCDKEELPPAFAFGHRQNVKLFFRRDIYERLSLDDLKAVAAHALARNLSHMYFQAWFMCAAAAFFVFAFLAWFAPQSWFLDEIGFRVYGPGPYYGSVLTFALVALPVLLFPFRLPMDAFLRHLIFASDTFAMKHTGLKVTVDSLIELFPSPMRHSSVTLGFFDLLFSHEPSLMSRIHYVQNKYEALQQAEEEKTLRNDSLTVLHQLENVSAALVSKQEQKVKEAEARDARLLRLNHQFEKILVDRAQYDPSNRADHSLAQYKDPHYEQAMKDLSVDNRHHPMYGKSLAQAVSALFFRLKQCIKRMTPGAKLKTKDSEPHHEEKVQQSVPVEVPPVENYAVQSVDPIVDLTEASDKTASCPQTQDLPIKPEETEQDSTDSDTSVHGFDILDVKEASSEVVQEPETTTSDDTAESEQTDTINAEEKNTSSTALQEKAENLTDNTDNEPVSGKNARRLKAVKTIAQRQRELYAKTHPDVR